MSDCIFCKIIKWEIPSIKIWEDDDFLAILDVFPNTKWMTLLMPKSHYDSDLFDISDQEFYTQYLLAVQKIVAILKSWLKVSRVAMVLEGTWVNHLHAKLYPLHGLWAKWTPLETKEEVYFDQYSWYISTQVGQKANTEHLQKVADEILSNI